MLLVLPPKRFQKTTDPRFDPIRPKAWFQSLEERRAKIGFLELAHITWRREGKLRKEAAAEYGVDERELGDYDAYMGGRILIDEPLRKTFRHIMDDAYGHYIGDGAARHLRHYLESIARFYGVKQRHVTEAWEVDANYYPTGYKPWCRKCGESSHMVKHQDGLWVCHRTHVV